MKTRLTKFSFGLLIVTLLSYSLFSKKENTNSNFTKYNVTFNKIDGVQVGTKVLISGIEVGHINKIALKENYPFVSILVDKKIKITDDSSISIQTDGLFGSKFLLIELGGNDNFMKENDFFSFHEDSIMIEDLLKKIIQIGDIKKNEI